MKAKDMEELPICLVIGTGAMNPHTIIEGILGELPQPSSGPGDLVSYKWDITTKYYTATVGLCSMVEKTLVDDQFASNVNAAIIYFDSSLSEGINEVEKWLPFVKEFDPEIKILVCQQCSVEDGNSNLYSKYEAQKWCIANGFELVELNPSEEIDPDDDFPETLGMARIIQALHAHSWPNLSLQSTSNTDKSRIEHLSRLLLGENVSENSFEGSSLDASDAAAGGLLDGDNIDESADDVESFEKLFQQLCAMKSQAGTLQEGSVERKVYAEQCVLAFWRAMKGDEDEIEDLASLDQGDHR